MALEQTRTPFWTSAQYRERSLSHQKEGLTPPGIKPRLDKKQKHWSRRIGKCGSKVSS